MSLFLLQRSLLQQRQDFNVLNEFDGVPIEPIVNTVPSVATSASGDTGAAVEKMEVTTSESGKGGLA